MEPDIFFWAKRTVHWSAFMDDFTPDEDSDKQLARRGHVGR